MMFYMCQCKKYNHLYNLCCMMMYNYGCNCLRNLHNNL